MLCHRLESIPGLQERSAASGCGVQAGCEPGAFQVPLFLERFNHPNASWCEDCDAQNQSACDAFNAKDEGQCFGLLRTRPSYFAHRSSFIERLLERLRDANAGLSEEDDIEAID